MKAFVVNSSVNRENMANCFNTNLQNATMMGAYGGLKNHLMWLCIKKSWILSWFQSVFIAVWISFSPLTKLVPLSDFVISGCPRQSTNLRRACRKDPVSRLWAISMWTATVTRRVKRTPYLFTKPRSLFIKKGKNNLHQRMWMEVCQVWSDVPANQSFSFLLTLRAAFYNRHLFTIPLNIRLASTF